MNDVRDCICNEDITLNEHVVAIANILGRTKNLGYLVLGDIE